MASRHIDLARLGWNEWFEEREKCGPADTLARVAAGGDPGPESAILKLKGTEIQQRITELNLEAAGVFAAPWGAEAFGPEFAHGATQSYLGGRATTIYGGASEVQKDVIAKNVLGLS